MHRRPAAAPTQSDEVAQPAGASSGGGSASPGGAGGSGEEESSQEDRLPAAIASSSRQMLKLLIGVQILQDKVPCLVLSSVEAIQPYVWASGFLIGSSPSDSSIRHRLREAADLSRAKRGTRDKGLTAQVIPAPLLFLGTHGGVPLRRGVPERLLALGC